MDGAVASFDVSSVGEHTLNLWMREDGLEVDKIVLTIDPTFVPTGYGPTESPEVLPELAAPVISPVSGNYYLSVPINPPLVKWPRYGVKRQRIILGFQNLNPTPVE